VIESTDFHVTISTHDWRMTPEENVAQGTKNAESAVRWIERITAEIEDDEDFETEEDDWRMDEFEWEKQLKESDAMSSRYGELLEKYADDPNRDDIIANEMGWSWFEDEDEDDEDDGESYGDVDATVLWAPDFDFDDFPELIPNPLTEGKDWIRTEEGNIKHPLSARAMHVAMDMWDFCKAQNLVGEAGDPDVLDMLFQAQTLGAKLAGALDALAYREEPDGGFVVAYLKRSLQYWDNAMRASTRVAKKNLLVAERLRSFRSDLFEIRQEIIKLMTHFRGLG